MNHLPPPPPQLPGLPVVPVTQVDSVPDDNRVHDAGNLSDCSNNPGNIENGKELIGDTDENGSGDFWFWKKGERTWTRAFTGL